MKAKIKVKTFILGKFDENFKIHTIQRTYVWRIHTYKNIIRKLQLPTQLRLMTKLNFVNVKL